MITPHAALEALLFAAGGPLEKDFLAKLLGIRQAELSAALAALSAALAGRGITLVESEHAAELRAASEAGAFVKMLREGELARDLGKAGLETLAVIAYQNGATRSDVDWVRGVNSSTSLRTLLMRGLIEGKEDARDRRRVRYSITTEALAHLDIAKVANLPRYAELAHDTQQAVQEDRTEDV